MPQFKTIRRKVVASAASTKRTEIPAEYKTIRKKALVKEAQQITEEIPAEYSNVTETTLVKEQKIGWEQVLCKQNADATFVTSLQKKLASMDYYGGPIDGILGSQTFSAVKRYAHNNDIAYGKNFVTMSVVKALNLN